MKAGKIWVGHKRELTHQRSWITSQQDRLSVHLWAVQKERSKPTRASDTQLPNSRGRTCQRPLSPSSLSQAPKCSRSCVHLCAHPEVPPADSLKTTQNARCRWLEEPSSLAQQELCVNIALGSF